ncbi:MAG: D-alanyl-D-alanine carboxypeptidase [Clostridia bacterium]|nr:D-alanyl-D-alanine carboxypeptidase [Clostridia bacterium]
MKRQKLFKMIIAFFCLIFVLISALGTFSVCASDSFPDVSGVNQVYLYNYESNKIIYSKGSGTSSIAPASTVKIMSGLLAIEHLADRRDEYVTLTKDMLDGVEGFTINLKAGDTLKINDLLYGLICGGGNDAAIVLANICSGSVESFVAEMNSTALSFGMKNTNYTNPTGIDDTAMNTTLNDTVIISKKAIENELFVKIASSVNHTYTLRDSAETKTIANRNALISSYSAIGYQNKRVNGLNAGMTDRGGYCVSAYASNGQDTYLCIVMGGIEATNGKLMSYSVVNSLLSYVFENYTYTKIAEKGDVIGEITVDLALPTNGSQAVTVNCILENDIYAFAPSNINYDRDLTYKTYFHADELTAPVYENTIVGGVDIYYEDNYIASARLLTESYIQESSLLVTLDNMKQFTLSRTILIFILILIPSVLLYFYFTVWRSKLRKKKAIENELKNKK